VLPKDEGSGDGALTFVGWRTKIGYGINTTNDYYATLDELSHAELEKHYSAYAAHVQSQFALEEGHQEIRWLKTVFGRLPNLERLGYTVRGYEGRIAILDLDGMKDLTPLAQATLMSRHCCGGTARTARQIMAVFTATLATRIKVKTFEANWVPWEMFTPAPKQWHVLFGAAKHLVSLQLHFRDFERSDIKNEDVVGANLATFIGSARNLTTLQMDLAGASEKASSAGLKGIFEGFITVRGLKRLMLQSMSCRKTTLQTIILHNAETLRSLELGWIYLLNDSGTDDWPGPSWVTTIRFLQSTLKLNYVALNGQLANGKNENWKTHSLEACPAETDTDLELYHGEESLRCRIERYILHGGECPLSSDDFSEIPTWERRWTVVKRGDHSWHSCEWSSLDHHWRSVTRP